MEDSTKTTKKRGRKPKSSKADQAQEQKPALAGKTVFTSVQYAGMQSASTSTTEHSVYTHASVGKSNKEELNINNPVIQEEESKPIEHEQVTEVQEHQQEEMKEPKCDAPCDSDEYSDALNKIVNSNDTRDLLEYLNMRMLPEHIESNLWARGVAKVLKRDGTLTWCVVLRTGVETHKIEKIFGSCSPIFKVGKIRNIEFIPREELIDNGLDNRTKRIMFLKKHLMDYSDRFDFMSDDELKREVADFIISKYTRKYER